MYSCFFGSQGENNAENTSIVRGTVALASIRLVPCVSSDQGLLIPPAIPAVVPGRILEPNVHVLRINVHDQVAEFGACIGERADVYAQIASFEWPNHDLVDAFDLTPLDCVLLTFP